jgi:hypothetical protein
LILDCRLHQRSHQVNAMCQRRTYIAGGRKRLVPRCAVSQHENALFPLQALHSISLGVSCAPYHESISLWASLSLSKSKIIRNTPNRYLNRRRRPWLYDIRGRMPICCQRDDSNMKRITFPVRTMTPVNTTKYDNLVLHLNKTRQDLSFPRSILQSASHRVSRSASQSLIGNFDPCRYG